MFQPDDPRNHELLVEVGNRGHFAASEPIDLGTHYDLIDHLWQNSNSRLPSDCCWIVAFRPALVHPRSGVAFAIARGTRYDLRVTGSGRQRYVEDLRTKAISDAERVGVAKENLERYLAMRDGSSDIGPSWVSGHFLPNEAEYLRYAYEECA